MPAPLALALALWGYERATCTFVAGRENQVYHVKADDREFALRLKRPGYRSEQELLSELQWLEAMDRAGLSVPRPQAALSGALLETADGYYVDLIDWLPGKPLGRSRDPLQLENTLSTFRALGEEMAKLHLACDAWETPDGFTRCLWDAEGLLGENPLWGRFWENPTLDTETADLLETFRAVAADDLLQRSSSLDYGLIHADLVRENVMLDGTSIRMIDFDDGGFGFRLFDVATALLKNMAEPNYQALKAALIEGYRAYRMLDTSALDLFMALRAVTYVGWIVPRMGEDGSPARNARFINHARQLCTSYLEQKDKSEGDAHGQDHSCYRDI
ncbi:homoserine kinase [Roseibium sp.]|uniref:homoserine kinase n=1 Tax=Roseibium sp. TaxID=1936156 RepID=UPI003BA9FD84